jgi:MYXO-CTERM domain-containing protein
MTKLQTAIRTMTALSLAAALLVLLLPARVQAAPGPFELSSPVNSAWATATCTFRWSTASSAVGYQLYVDGVLKKDAIAATSPSYTLLPTEALSHGWHTWHVVALDDTGATTQSASTWSARVDATPPSVVTLASPGESAWIPSSPVSFSWSASSDSDSGLLYYEVWVDGQLQSGCSYFCNPVTDPKCLSPIEVCNQVFPPATSASVEIPPTVALSSLSSLGGCDDWKKESYWSCPTKTYTTYPMTLEGRNGHTRSSLEWSSGCCDSNRAGTATLASAIDLSNLGQVIISYDHLANGGDAASYATEFSYDGGTTWTQLGSVKTTNGKWSPGGGASLGSPETAKGMLRFSASDNSWANSWNISNITIKGITAGAHTWYVTAVDTAGNRTPSLSRTFRYDLPPASFDLVSPADQSWSTDGLPVFTWKGTTDAGSGLAKYQVWIDGSLAIDNIPVSATTATATKAIAEGAHRWQVYAVDNAGAVRRSREEWTLGIDTTVPEGRGNFCPGTVTSPTPQICWNTPRDLGSGVDHYSLVIDGVVNRDRITPGTTGTDCATPTTPLAEGKHTLSITAYDVAGNSTTLDCPPLAVDFNPPSSFWLLSPLENDSGYGGVVDTLTPTFSWEASSSSSSGLDHYELYIDEARTSNGLYTPAVCTVCAIPATATSVTLSQPVTAGRHFWAVRAFDRLGGFVQAGVHTQDQDGWFTARCAGACLSSPEPAPEPPRDAGVDAPIDLGKDSPVTTSTGTGTSIGSLTTTTTSTATAATATNTITATASATSTAVGPRPDAAPPITVADAATPIRADALASRDGVAMDAARGVADATVIALASDAASLSDGGAAAGTGRDGGQTRAADGAGVGGAPTAGKASSGCGCVIGGANTGSTLAWPMIILGLLALRRGRRSQR